MSKSIKLKNNNYWDSSSITHDKKLLKNMLTIPKRYDGWQKNYDVSYENWTTPVLIWVCWSASVKVYTYYRHYLVELGSKVTSGDTISYTIDTDNKKIKFTLSNTGLIYTLNFPQAP